MTLTFEAVLVAVSLAFMSAGLATEEPDMTFGVLKPDDGLDPGACWISLPCSDIRVGASLGRRFRICGVISFRTRSFTGSLERSEEYMSTSNYRHI